MKKALIVFGLILGGIFVLLSVLDTSDYKLEKRLWQIRKQLDIIARDPAVVPEKKFEDVVRQYRRAIERFPDSKLVPGIYFQIGRIYGFKKDLAAARGTMEEILKRYADNPALSSEALFYMGKTYEIEKNEDQVIAAYQRLLKDYPLTRAGLNAPLYVVDYYLKINKEKEAAGALKKAVVFYQELSRKHPKSLVALEASRLLVTTYLAQKNWKEAVNTSEKILLGYLSEKQIDPRVARQIVQSINSISTMQLKDYDRPTEIYQRFIEQNPDHTLNKVLQEMITAFQKLKDKEAVAAGS